MRLTLSWGTMSLGDEVSLGPSALRYRVRSIDYCAACGRITMLVLSPFVRRGTKGEGPPGPRRKTSAT